MTKFYVYNTETLEFTGEIRDDEHKFDNATHKLSSTATTIPNYDNINQYLKYNPTNDNWDSFDIEIEGEFYLKAGGTKFTKILQKNMQNYTEIAPKYPVLQGDILSFNSEWVYSAYSSTTYALALNDKKAIKATEFQDNLKKIQDNTMPIILKIKDTNDQTIAFSTTFELLKNITKESLKSGVFEFNTADHKHRIYLNESDDNERKKLLNEIESQFNLYKRKSGEIQGIFNSLVEATTTFEDLEKLSVNVFDFDNNGNNLGWGYDNARNSLILKIQNSKIIDITVKAFTNGQLVDLDSQSKAAFVDKLLTNN